MHFPLNNEKTRRAARKATFLLHIHTKLFCKPGTAAEDPVFQIKFSNKSRNPCVADALGLQLSYTRFQIHKPCFYTIIMFSHRYS